MNKWLLFSQHVPMWTPMMSHPLKEHMHLHFSCVHYLWDSEGVNSLIIQGKLWVFCQAFGRGMRSDPWGTPKITPEQDKVAPQCETVPRLLCERKSFPSTFLSVCLKASAYLRPDSVEQPCWPDSCLSTPLIHKHQRDCNLVPPKTFQGRLGGHKTTE